MKSRLAATLASGVFVLMFSGAALVAAPAVGSAEVRYPGALVARSQQIDVAHLAHGWLTWHATYETNATVEAVALWYANKLPGAETRAVGQCQTLHQSQALWHMQRSVTVQLCAERTGTAILVNEDVYLAP